MIEIVSPSKAFFTKPIPEKITKYLSFKNKTFEYQLKRLEHNRWLKQSKPEEWSQSIADLKAKVAQVLVFKEKGMDYIRPGSIAYLLEEGLIQDSDVRNTIKYPIPKPFRWYNKLPFQLYDYQIASVDKLIEEKHGCVSLCTGAGKSLVIASLAQKLGQKTIVSVPSESIFLELLKLFEYHFGKESVGALGGGKKRFGKRFMICIADSLVMLKKGTPEYEEVSSAGVLICDESHTFAAETLDQTCHGVLENVPYRFFLSGTQTRGDGTIKLLQSIIGKCVHSLTTAEAIAGNYVCDHEFRIIPVKASVAAIVMDPLVNKRNHFLKNTEIRDFVARLANLSWTAKKQQTLVLVDELSQIVLLAKELKVPFAVATSASNKHSILAAVMDLKEPFVKKNYDNLFSNITPDQLAMFNLLKNSEPEKAVEDFNKAKVHVLVGTSCISTGTNIFPSHNTVNWQGGASEVRTKQGAVGRSVRILEKSKYADLHSPKPKSIIWDFDVLGMDDLKKHLWARIRYYKDSGVPIKGIDEKGI